MRIFSYFPLFSAIHHHHHRFLSVHSSQKLFVFGKKLSSHLFYLIIEFSSVMRIFIVSCCNKGGSLEEFVEFLGSLKRIFELLQLNFTNKETKSLEKESNQVQKLQNHSKMSNSGSKLPFIPSNHSLVDGPLD